MSIHVAAVDLGATSGRVMRAVVSEDAVEMVEVARFPNGPVQRADGLHWDIEALREHIWAGLRQAFVEDPLITSIGIDSWAVDYALLRSGEVLAEPFHYRDERTARGVAAVHEIVPAEELYSSSGVQHLPFNTVFQLAAEAPETLASADTFLLIPDLFAFWLTGRAVAERTNASTTALLDPKTGDWNTPLIGRIGIPGKLFPCLVRPGEIIGPLTPEMSKELGAPTGVTVRAVGSHDTASAVVSVPMTRSGSAYISCGTWGLVGLELAHPVITNASRIANFTNEAGVGGRVRFLHNVTGLWILSEVIREWESESGPVELSALLSGAARVSEPVPTFDANDPRLLAPGRMATRIEEILAEEGKRLPASRPELARCILESLASAFASAVKTAGTLARRDVEVIHIVGGGALNALLCQLIANHSGVVVLAGPVEATALGNVLVQARSHGGKKNLEDLRSLVAEAIPLFRFEPADSVGEASGATG